MFLIEFCANYYFFCNFFSITINWIQQDEQLAYEGPDSNPGQKALNEVMNVYMVLRNNVLTPILKDATGAVLKTSLGRSTSGNENLNEKIKETGGNDDTKQNSAPPSGSDGSGELNLCAGIRQAYSILLRVCQLENHLFESLFKPSVVSTVEDSKGPSSKTESLDAAKEVKMFSGTEVLTIVENICGTTGDAMR